MSDFESTVLHKNPLFSCRPFLQRVARIFLLNPKSTRSLYFPNVIKSRDAKSSSRRGRKPKPVRGFGFSSCRRLCAVLGQPLSSQIVADRPHPCSNSALRGADGVGSSGNTGRKSA